MRHRTSSFRTRKERLWLNHESGKRRYVYSKNLTTLRQREEQLLRDHLDGINSEQAKNQTLNDVFDKYMATRKDLAERTFAGYMCQYDAYVRKGIGNRKIKDITFEMALRDCIIRTNPTHIFQNLKQMQVSARFRW